MACRVAKHGTPSFFMTHVMFANNTCEVDKLHT